ncbi:Fic family protein [Cecembia calidifontis]|jgi:Fic family protein|uniref:Fic/DOC family protein n=1 Tax=Cecembia calidifontis TaxID=1187080 RepID=A0A4Q7P8T5_9BACT|nr:Fic family protein [Cecembia calidifontis]RZS96541.1 Fic/DOC family protein [Cecembia calidifontis]
MVNPTLKDELPAIKNVIAKNTYGASIEDIMSGCGLNLELRTLQRRLKKLKEEGIIFTTGGSKSTRYHLSYSDHLVRESEQEKLIRPKREGFSISKESEKIISYLSNPLSDRKKVGYNVEFLDSYRPNIDAYLSDEDIHKLTLLGYTNSQNQPAGTHAREILNRLLIDLSWNSSRLEGNTYSLLDTQRLLELGESAEGKSLEEAQMIINHKDAIEFLVDLGEELDFKPYILLNIHALLAENLMKEQASLGRLRSMPVGIFQSAYTPLSIPQLIVAQFELLLKKVMEIRNPFEQAFFMMVHLPYLQPFDDVNKRTSRLAANIPLIKSNLSPISFVEVPSTIYTQGILGVYELNQVDLLKDVFMWAYEKSAVRYAAIRQTISEPDPFRTKYRDDIKKLIMKIVSENLNPNEGSQLILSTANHLPKEDRDRFREMVEGDLLVLNEGNFARFRVSLSEFKRWKENWSRKV